jgi:transposase
VKFVLSAGQCHDSKFLIPLLNGLNIEKSNVLADRAYDSDEILKHIEQHGANATIPSKSNRKIKREIDNHLYKERHLVECFFQKLKWFRRVFVRFEKLDSSFLAFVYLAATIIWLK